MESLRTPQTNDLHSTMDTINCLTTLLSNLTVTEASTLQPQMIHQIGVLLHDLNSSKATISTSTQITHLIAILDLRAQFSRLTWPSEALTPSFQATITRIYGSTSPYLTAIMTTFSDIESDLIAAIIALLTQPAPEQPLAALQHYAALLSLLPHLTEQGSSLSSALLSSSTLADHRKSILAQITRILSSPAVFDYLTEDPLSVLVEVTNIRQIIRENCWGEENGGANLDDLVGRQAMAVGYDFLAREEMNACGQGLSDEERRAKVDERMLEMIPPLWGMVSARGDAGAEAMTQEAGEASPARSDTEGAPIPLRPSATDSDPVVVHQQPVTPVKQEKEKEKERMQEPKQESSPSTTPRPSNPLLLQIPPNPIPWHPYSPNAPLASKPSTKSADSKSAKHPAPKRKPGKKRSRLIRRRRNSGSMRRR
ncbi:hypothetical protein G7Y79_00026g058500 [Physcia stellaris]|nr:hypothetical protein G7Y79_00026g058500 [Physcia stellaris]